jgi:hypothetical protein
LIYQVVISFLKASPEYHFLKRLEPTTFGSLNRTQVYYT